MGSSASQTLRLFNEKADKLMGLRFTQALKNNVEVEGSYHPSNGWTATRTGPGSEETEAFVLTLRFFLQNNERISIANTADLYETLAVPEKLKEAVRKTPGMLNEFLDSDAQIIWKNERLTRRRVLDVFLYGGLAHANPEKKALYDEWVADAGTVSLPRRGVHLHL